MNNRDPTLEKKEPVWITIDDWLWSIAVALMRFEDSGQEHKPESGLPVISF